MIRNIRTGNRKLMRELNTNLVLNLLRERNSISQIEIANTTRLSAGTVTSIVKELMERNFVEEIGYGESTGGRRPTMLRFNPEAQYVISVGFFADEMHIAILDLVANIKNKTTHPTGVENGVNKVVENFAEQATLLLEELNIPKSNVLGIGVSFEGIVDHDKGVLVLCNRFGWRNVPVKELIEKEFGIRTFVESDGRAMALGEHWYGIGKGTGDMIVVDIDAGIGAAVISDGRIARGRHSMEGEMGHNLIIPDGPLCICGKRGCLEAVASGSAIISKIRRGLKEGIKSSISDSINSPSTIVAIRAVFQAAKEGDEFAIQVINEAGYYLGLAIAGVINYADPELVVLTGCVTYESKGMLLKIIKEIVQEHVVDNSSRIIRIEEGVLGDNAALIGAATLVYREAFRLPLVHS